MKAYGKLFGIGVGPGDSELLTLKAARILSEVDVVLAASSSKNEYSRSLDIARGHIREDCEVIRLKYPMTRDDGVLEKAWKENADIAADILEKGRSAAFLTLGDPLIYSTFGYMMQTLARFYPEYDIEVVPGVTSYQAAAAKTRTVLVESGQNLLLTSGVASEEGLRKSLSLCDNAVILKAYRNFVDLRGAVEGLNGKYNSKFVSRLGMDGEQIFDKITDVPDKTHYLSLMLLTAN